MAFHGPSALYDPIIGAGVLEAYYEGWSTNTFKFTGSQFDTWPGNECDRFTADDLVAVTFLSVEVPPRTAHALILDRADEFTAMLRAVPTDVDLATAGAIEPSWWKLMAELKSLPGVGPTMASKLFARKRPRLRPIYDSVVEQFLGADKQQWEPLRHHLATEAPGLHAQLARIVEDSGIPPTVTPLRALDVICWMEARRQRPRP